MSTIFISYAREDGEIANRIYDDLKRAGHNPWIDTEDLLPGQNWETTIRDVIAKSSFFLALISSKSINKRGFVQKELRQGLSLLDEFPPGAIYVIPVRIEDVEPTHSRLSKLQWVDLFRSYEVALERIKLSIVDQSTLSEEEDTSKITQGSGIGGASPSTLAHATASAVRAGLPLLSKPFHRPFQYVGMTVSNAARSTASEPNDAGHISIDSKDAYMLLEAKGNFVSYVEVSLKKTAPCAQDQPFDSEPILGALSISPSELELARKQTHFHTYYDHKRKLKVGVSCSWDGAPLSAGFSSKNYGD